jgi:SAM-dependent methyltransferase
MKTNPDDAPRPRRSLTHVGGATDTEGHPADARLLAEALAVVPASDRDDDPARGHVHGFHTYPARLHPLTAARLVTAFAPAGGTVLDPFCGSGTVLVEAVLAGRRAVGTDLNPLAVRLAAAKVRPRPVAELDQLARRATEVAAVADARRKAKAGASRRFPPDDVALFEPHVLLELDSLRGAVAALPDEPARSDLWLVLSAVLVKLSKRKSDTTVATPGRRTAAGAAAKFFVQKAEELAGRLADFSGRVPSPWFPARVEPDDATHLRSQKPGSADAVITSPPYAATYDYLAHHELRLRWLDLDPGPLARNEIGSRSAYRRQTPTAARRKWAGEVAGFLTAVRRALRPGGPAVLVLADSAVGGEPLRADAVVAELARGCGFEPAARASQVRPHFHLPTMRAFRDRPRMEHALLLRKLG